MIVAQTTTKKQDNTIVMSDIDCLLSQNYMKRLIWCEFGFPVAEPIIAQSVSNIRVISLVLCMGYKKSIAYESLYK